MNILSEKARIEDLTAESVLRAQFSSVSLSGAVSAQFISGSDKKLCAGVSGLSFSTPVISVFLQADTLYAFFETHFRKGRSVLISYVNGGTVAFTADSGDLSGVVSAAVLSAAESGYINKILADSLAWGGTLDASGGLTCDLASPAPGPHYYTNLLIGNRIDFDRPLQSTPKGVADRLGGGSFRSHADTRSLQPAGITFRRRTGFLRTGSFISLKMESRFSIPEVPYRKVSPRHLAHMRRTGPLSHTPWIPA